MRSQEIRNALRRTPFTPVLLALSDGRSVLIRHPDQVVVTERSVFVGLARVERSRPLATPSTAEAIAREGLWLNMLQIVAIESANGEPE